MAETKSSGRGTPPRTRGSARTRAASKAASGPTGKSSANASAKVGLALAGGGPLGGIYEVGALLALADSIEGLDLNRLDAYVGVSSGGFVAAALANGISPAQMYRLFIADGVDAALKPEIFLRPAFSEFGRRLGKLPALALRASFQYLRDPFHRGIIESFATLAQAVPTGFLRQPRHRRLPCNTVRSTWPYQRLQATRTQAVSRGHQPRHRRVGDFWRSGS